MWTFPHYTRTWYTNTMFKHRDFMLSTRFWNVAAGICSCSVTRALDYKSQFIPKLLDVAEVGALCRRGFSTSNRGINFAHEYNTVTKQQEQERNFFKWMYHCNTKISLCGIINHAKTATSSKYTNICWVGIMLIGFYIFGQCFVAVNFTQWDSLQWMCAKCIK